MKKGSLWGQSQGIIPDHSESYSSQKPSLWGPSWLRGVCMNTGECPRLGHMWKKKPGNWPEWRQNSRRTALYKWLYCLLTVLLLTRYDIHTLSLQECISALLLSQLNYFFMWSPTCAMFLMINFVSAFTVSASVINAFFTGGNDPWKKTACSL